MDNTQSSSEKFDSKYTAEVLIEALPWIKAITGKTVVIKYGGSAMTNPELRDAVVNDIILMKIIGINPVIVHGGGKAISKSLEDAKVDFEFINGTRATSPEAMKVVSKVLSGEVNQELVTAINIHGNLAVGVTGCDAGTIMARAVSPELMRAGTITAINPAYIEDLINSDFIPIIATIGLGEDGEVYNINADEAAGEIAGAIGAHKLIYLTDVDGIYSDFNNKSSLISNMTVESARKLVDENIVSTGMIPKLRSCISALESGVYRGHIINGTTPHSLLLEILTNSGVGSVIHCSQEAYANESHPLNNFALRLVENRNLR